MDTEGPRLGGTQLAPQWALMALVELTHQWAPMALVGLAQTVLMKLAHQ